MELGYNRDYWRGLVNVALNLQVSLKQTTHFILQFIKIPYIIIF